MTTTLTTGVHEMGNTDLLEKVLLKNRQKPDDMDCTDNGLSLKYSLFLPLICASILGTLVFLTVYRACY